jgi:hypothetical protein
LYYRYYQTARQEKEIKASTSKRKKQEGVISSMLYLIHCKNLCKCHSVPPPSTTIKKKEKEKPRHKKERKKQNYLCLQMVWSSM